MGGCYSSDLNKPPEVTSPAKRMRQSNQVVITELSDLDEEDLMLKEPPEITYKGRGSNSVGMMQPTHKQKIEKELKKIQRETNKEVKRKQEIQLQEKIRQQKHNFTLQKEEETTFRLEQEKHKAKQQEMLQIEMERRREIFKFDDEEGNIAKVEKVDDAWSSFKKGRNSNDDIESNNNEESRVYRPQQFNLTGITNSGWGLEVQDLEEDPEPAPPTYRKKDIVPNINEFNLFDKHAVKAPVSARSSVSTLVNYLKTGAENHFQLVRMFYRWITFNISFDVEGYFGEDKLQSVEAEDVLQSGITIAEGYANLMEAMCRYEGIPVKVIHGLVKGYNYQVGDIINFTESRIMHSWNAVYINRNWFFIDCAWGAGHVDRERKWHRQFQEFYFIVDPDKMIVDHFPFMDKDLRTSAKWQLLPSPVSANSFNQRLKMERAALEWEVKPVTHTQHHIITVRKEIVVQLEEVASILEDYTVQFQRKDGSRNLDKFFFACKLNERTLRIEIRPPEEVDYLLNIYMHRGV
ncbi:kyphoscoliosis peptidase-like [Mercenaria mercenaria]|uniref:kyphoscoliosis peptidase-like n=1 Tax=Mercenaria mercenaria TaxID=6596 RepID=UPI00234E4920|nr:kyphoscoliosis peptidase-like [Mercenaria mercenaria]